MRIAYLDPHPVPDASPEALQILQTVDALGEVGVQVDLVTPEPAGETDPGAILGRPIHPNVTLTHVPDLRRRWWARAIGLRRSTLPFHRQSRRWLENHAVDAVLARNLKLAEALLDAAASRPHPPLFFETHELFAQTFREEHERGGLGVRRKLAALEAREARVYKEARGIIALTGLLLDDIRRVYRSETPGIVAPDGVDLRAARSARRDSQANRSAVPVLLFLGSLHRWKGVETAIRAMVKIDGAKLRIVGGPHDRIAELAALCRRLGVEDKVQLVGPVPPSERFAVIDNADICLLPLNDTAIGGRYTSPLKLFEYMAMGKAIVASDLPALRIILEDRRDALLVSPGSPDALAAAIGELLVDPALRDRIGTHARMLSEASFSWTERSKRIGQFVAQTLGLPVATNEASPSSLNGSVVFERQ